MDHKINTVIEAVSNKANRKDGTPYIDKNGKPFSVVSFKLSEELIDDTAWGGWCTVMDYNSEFNLNKGEMLSGYISKREVNDNTYWNFRKPSRIDELEERIIVIENQLSLGSAPEPKQEEKPIEPEKSIDEEVEFQF